MKYKLTNNTIEYNGIKLYQIQAISNINSRIIKGSLGGFVENYNNLSQYGKCWIYPNSILYNSMVQDDILIHENCIISNSFLYGRMIIYKNSIIDNCILSNEDNLLAVIEKNTIIKNKNFNFQGKINNLITNTNYFKYYNNGSVAVLCGEEYCKVGCLTLTYLQAWKAINFQNNIIPDAIKQHYQTAIKWTLKENINWLKEICKKELQRLNIKIEESI